MAKDKKGFYYENTVEMELNGKKVRVNKHEAKALQAKISKKK